MTPLLFPCRTIGAEATVEGAGLFTGVPCRAIIRPAPGGTGLVFLRGDVRILAAAGALSAEPAHPAFASMPARSANLGAGSARALTVEHLLSALAGLGVTDALIELTAPEVPILDGSALPFVMSLAAAGVVGVAGGAGAEVEPVAPAEPITVQQGDEQGGASITALPRQAPGWSVRYELDYGPGAPIPAQAASWDGSPATYAREIAPARTFCTDGEALAMRQAGLFGRLSPRDMLVIGPDGPIDNALRFDNEAARHKLLDVIGDLALVGRPIQADIVARRSGHALNHELARRLCR